jgi:hypothetical protein
MLMDLDLASDFPDVLSFPQIFAQSVTRIGERGGSLVDLGGG